MTTRYTDPNFVLGAVLAQLEDLEPHQQRQVLVNAMTSVAAATPPVLAEDEEIIDMSRDELRRYALGLQTAHDPENQEGNNYARCMHCGYTRAPCDVYDLATAVLALLDYGRTD